MNYNAKGYSAIQEGKASREAYILKTIDRTGVYSTLYCFTIAGLNAVERLQKKGIIKYDGEKSGYIRVKSEN
jgi:hypothetical protein